jgi:hypothetical protein
MLAVLNSVREESDDEADDLPCEPFVITPRARRSGWVLSITRPKRKLQKKEERRERRSSSRGRRSIIRGEFHAIFYHFSLNIKTIHFAAGLSLFHCRQFAEP